MIDLVQKLGPMKETVCRAYVHAELKGEIARTKDSLRPVARSLCRNAVE